MSRSFPIRSSCATRRNETAFSSTNCICPRTKPAPSTRAIFPPHLVRADTDHLRAAAHPLSDLPEIRSLSSHTISRDPVTIEHDIPPQELHQSDPGGILGRSLYRR